MTEPNTDSTFTSFPLQNEQFLEVQHTSSECLVSSWHHQISIEDSACSPVTTVAPTLQLVSSWKAYSHTRKKKKKHLARNGISQKDDLAGVPKLTFLWRTTTQTNLEVTQGKSAALYDRLPASTTTSNLSHSFNVSSRCNIYVNPVVLKLVQLAWDRYYKSTTVRTEN